MENGHPPNKKRTKKYSTPSLRPALKNVFSGSISAVYFDIWRFFVKYRFKMHFYNTFIKASAFLYFLRIIISLILSNILYPFFYLNQYVLFLITFLFLRFFIIMSTGYLFCFCLFRQKNCIIFLTKWTVLLLCSPGYSSFYFGYTFGYISEKSRP